MSRVSQSFSALEVEVMIAALDAAIRHGVDGLRSAELERLRAKALEMRKVVRARQRQAALALRLARSRREAQAS